MRGKRGQAERPRQNTLDLGDMLTAMSALSMYQRAQTESSGESPRQTRRPAGGIGSIWILALIAAIFPAYVTVICWMDDAKAENDRQYKYKTVESEPEKAEPTKKQVAKLAFDYFTTTPIVFTDEYGYRFTVISNEYCVVDRDGVLVGSFELEAAIRRNANDIFTADIEGFIEKSKEAVGGL